MFSNSKIDNYTCNICKTSSNILGVKRGVKAIRCPSCGFVWKDTKFLPDDYKKTWNYGSSESFDVRNMDKVYAYRLRKILNISRCNVKKLMDFGCGKGGFVRYLREKSYESYGCDLGDNIPNDHFFFKKNIIDVNESDFDVIVSIQTFEHIEDLNSIVFELTKRLKNNGMLYIETHFTHVDSVLGWGYFDLANHVSFHNPEAMKRLMDNSGMDLIYFDNKKRPLNSLWLKRKLIHISHVVVPYPIQKTYWYGATMNFLSSIFKILFGKKVVIEPSKDYVSDVLEVSNCVFIGIKR